MKKQLFLLLLSASFFTAQSQQTLSLSTCIQQALEANWGIKIAKNEQKIAENNFNYNPFLPVIYADASQREAFNDTKRKDANGNETNFALAQTDNLNALVALQWTIFDGASMFVTYRKMKELKSVGELNTQWQIENLIANVTAAYYNVWIQTKLLEAMEQIMDVSRLRFKIAQDKYLIGAMSGLEMRQSRIDLNADSSAYLRQEEMLIYAHIQLNTLMNTSLEQQSNINDTLILLPLMDYENIKNDLLRNNTSLQIAQKGIRISELDLSMARAAYFPTIQFNPGYQFNLANTPAAMTTYNRTHGLFWGFSIRVPIFNQLTVRTQTQNAKLNIETSVYTYKELELTMLSNLATLFASYQNNHKLLLFEDQNKDIAYETLQSAIERYQIGNLSGLEFRDYQRSYIDAITRKMTAAYQAKVSEIAILLLSGGLRLN